MATQTGGQRLHRSRDQRMLFGVAGGLGEYFDVDPTIIRLAFVLATLAGGAGILAYVVLAIVLPEEGADDVTGQEGLRRNLASLGEDTRQFVGGQRVAGSADTDEQTRRNRNLGALLLIGLGIVFLASNLGLFDWFRWGVFWPLILIVLGLALLLRRPSSL